jgi:SAM-dependent methyltransferase
MNRPIQDSDQVRAAVRARYSAIADGGTGCCGPAPAGCCGPDAPAATDLGYAPDDLAGAPAGANLGLGCGNPIALASLRPGEVVLDLGCGAGFDAFLAAARVQPGGRVIGVDMTPQMLARARANQQAAGVAGVEFRLGEIEHLPVADRSVDVVLSNCVINLSPDKARVFAEAFRVLRPGGRLAIADIVALQPIPAELQQDFALLTGCVAGAAPIDELRRLLQQTGFADVRIRTRDGSRELVESWFPARGVADLVASASIEAVKPAR